MDRPSGRARLGAPDRGEFREAAAAVEKVTVGLKLTMLFQRSPPLIRRLPIHFCFAAVRPRHQTYAPENIKGERVNLIEPVGCYDRAQGRDVTWAKAKIAFFSVSCSAAIFLFCIISGVSRASRRRRSLSAASRCECQEAKRRDPRSDPAAGE